MRNWKLLGTAVVLAGLCLGQETTTLLVKVVDTETKQGVAGAKVVLLKREGSFSYGPDVWKTPLGADDPEAARLAALTGDLGQSSFQVPKTASYMVFVSCEGYVQWGMSFETQKVLKASEGRLEVAIQKEAGVSGRVIDVETREPVAGVEVMAMRWQTLGDSRALLPANGQATTDREGHFRLLGLTPGEYVLAVKGVRQQKFQVAGEAEEFRQREVRQYGINYYPGVARREEATPVLVPGGASVGGLEFRLAKRRVGAIRGKVAAAGKLRLDLFRYEAQGDVQSHTSVAGGEIEAEQGFRLEDVAPGKYWLLAKQEERGAIVHFDMEDGNVDGLDMVLTKGVTVHGVVRAEEALQEEWKKTPKVVVTFSPLRRSYTKWDMEKLEAAPPEWRFEKSSLMDGRYRVDVRGLPKGMAVGEVRYCGQPAAGGVFAINPSALEQQLEVVVWQATASLQVTVRRGTKAEPEADVVAFREPFEASNARDSKKAAADAEGRALLANLLAGRYRVFAVPKATAWRTDPRLDGWLTGATLVELSTGASKALELKVIEP